MDFKKHDGEDCGDQERMQGFVVERIVGPSDQLFPSGAAYQRGLAVWNTTPISLPSSSKALTWLGLDLYSPRWRRVFFGVAQKIAVKLFDVIFR